MPPCDLYQWAPAPSTPPCLIQSDPHLWPSHCSSHPIRYIEYVSQVFPLAYTPLERYHPSVLDSSTTSIVLKSSYVKNAPKHSCEESRCVQCRASNPHKLQLMDEKSILKNRISWYLEAQLIPGLLLLKMLWEMIELFSSLGSLYLTNY